MPEFYSTFNRSVSACEINSWSAKEPFREIPEEPHDPEILPDLPPETEPDLSPEIPAEPRPEILPDGTEPEISPPPFF